MAIKLGDALLFLGTDDTGLDKGLDQAESKTKGWTGKMGGVIKGALGGLAVGAAAAAVGAVAAIGTAALNVSSETHKAAGQMAASLDIPIEEANKFAAVAKQVYGNNFADSVEDAASGVQEVAKQMKLAADDPSLQTLTENAFRLRDVFGVEVGESVNAAKTLMDNFGLTGQEAFDMIARGYQSGLDTSGDFLDTIGEYSTQFANGGASAEQFFSLLDSGLQGGMLGTDKAADAFKEFRLRIADGSTATADGLKLLGINAEELNRKMADGSITAADAFTLVTEALSATEDPTLRMQAGAALLGSQFEDLGDSAVAGLTLASDAFADVEGATTSLDAKYNSFGDAANAIWRRVVVSITPVTDKLLDMVNKAMPAVLGAFDKFDKTVGPVVAAAGDIISKVVGAVKGLFGQLGESTGGLSNRFGGLGEKVREIMALIQTLIQQRLSWIQAFWETWGGAITALVSGMWNQIQIVFSTALSIILDLVKLVLQVLTGDWQGAADTIRNIVQTLWDGITALFQNGVNTIRTAFTSINWGNIGRAVVDGIWSGMKNAWDGMMGWFDSKLEGMRNRLPFSEPKDPASPLRGLTQSGAAIVDMLRVGIERAGPLVAPELTMPALPDFSGMLAGAGAAPAPVTISISQTFNGQADAERVREASRGGLLEALRAAGMA